jgi:hypothetical protein
MQGFGDGHRAILLAAAAFAALSAVLRWLLIRSAEHCWLIEGGRFVKAAGLLGPNDPGANNLQRR